MSVEHHLGPVVLPKPAVGALCYLIAVDRMAVFLVAALLILGLMAKSTPGAASQQSNGYYFDHSFTSGLGRDTILLRGGSKLIVRRTGRRASPLPPLDRA
jgi:hypothetical protein